MLASTGTVIVDEIHAIAANKRGAHLALSLERLAALCDGRLVRIGLSATQNPINTIAHFLIGASPQGLPADEVTIADIGHQRRRELVLEVPDAPLEAVMSAEVWDQVYDRLMRLIEAHRTTLVFVNTRLSTRAAWPNGSRTSCRNGWASRRSPPIMAVWPRISGFPPSSG
jgi:ATP-dependent Lhr-like helicase